MKSKFEKVSNFFQMFSAPKIVHKIKKNFTFSLVFSCFLFLFFVFFYIKQSNLFIYIACITVICHRIPQRSFCKVNGKLKSKKNPTETWRNSTTPVEVTERLEIRKQSN